MEGRSLATSRQARQALLKIPSNGGTKEATGDRAVHEASCGGMCGSTWM